MFCVKGERQPVGGLFGDRFLRRGLSWSPGTWLLSIFLVGQAWLDGCSGTNGQAKSVAHPVRSGAAGTGARKTKLASRPSCPKHLNRDALDETVIRAFVQPESRAVCKANLVEPVAQAVFAAGKVWVVLGRPGRRIGHTGPISVEGVEGTTVVMSRHLGFGAPKGVAVRILGPSGRICRGSLGPPVVLARLTSPSVEGLSVGDGSGAVGSRRGRAAGAPGKAEGGRAEKLDDLWSSAGLHVAAEVVGCGGAVISGKNPVLAEPLDRKAPVKLARAVAVEPAVRAEAVERLRDLLEVADSDKKAGPKDLSIRALVMPRGGRLLAVGAAWVDWPVCGAKGYGGSALWYLFRGRWHLVKLWKGEREPLRLLMAGDLTGNGDMECILEESSATGRRVLYKIQNRDSSDEGELVPLMSEESEAQGCGC